jgi:hypothetical protein
MTVGAVNKDEEFVGYSSRGPACLDSDKPDFCSVSHFTGYFASDSGTFGCNTGRRKDVWICSGKRA